MARKESKRKVTASSECDAEDRSAAYDTQSTNKRGRRVDSKSAKASSSARSKGPASGQRGRKRKMENTKEEDQCGEPANTGAASESCADPNCGAGSTAKRARRTLVNHRISKALLERARLVERDVLPGVALHYVIDRRLNQTDIEWKLRSTAIGLVIQCPHGLGEVQRRKLLDDVRNRVVSQSKDKRLRTTLSVLKKANMVEMRAKYGGMRYTTAQTRFDGSSYAVLGNLPGHREVAEKLAELKARMVPLLEHFNVELKELKEIVSQSLRGRIFTNKDAMPQNGRITARIDLRVRQFTNLEKIRSDRGLMITLIHELAHAITPTDVKQVKGRGKVKVSHGPLFWENVMKIAKVASQIEDPTCDRSGATASHGDECGEGEEGERRAEAGEAEREKDDRGKRKPIMIFELTDELEFRDKVEKEDSLSDELDDEDEDDDASPSTSTSTSTPTSSSSAAANQPRQALIAPIPVVDSGGEVEEVRDKEPLLITVTAGV